MYTACTQNVEEIKTTISLKNETKEKFTFLWFNLLPYSGKLWRMAKTTNWQKKLANK